MTIFDNKQIGPYKIEQELGRGGMAIVYKAWQANLERSVALKILPEHFTFDQHFVQRFINEAKIASQLNHPNIVKIYDIGSDGSINYICMEYIEGNTLSNIFAQKGPLPIEEAVHITRQIADALDYSHRAGVVHRDIKPSNILIDSRGKVTITDFGIAQASSYPGFTPPAGVYLGTPAYMAPEQASMKDYDHRVDLYALGILIFQMLTNRLPYDADTPFSVMHKHVTEKIPSVRQEQPEVPKWMELIIYKAMAKNPQLRYQSGSEIIRDLDSRGAAIKEPVAVKAKINKVLISAIVLVLAFILYTIFSSLNWRNIIGEKQGTGAVIASSAPNSPSPLPTETAYVKKELKKLCKISIVSKPPVANIILF